MPFNYGRLQTYVFLKVAPMLIAPNFMRWLLKITTYHRSRIARKPSQIIQGAVTGCIAIDTVLYTAIYSYTHCPFSLDNSHMKDCMIQIGIQEGLDLVGY